MNVKYSLEYEESSGTLFVRIGEKRYVICQESGELAPARGHSISDYYWSDIPDSAETVRAIFRALAASQSSPAS